MRLKEIGDWRLEIGDSRRETGDWRLEIEGSFSGRSAGDGSG
jgi:hypothetical protein